MKLRHRQDAVLLPQASTSINLKKKKKLAAGTLENLFLLLLQHLELHFRGILI